MKLQRLRLQNFRQHVDNTIEFRGGITGVIGPNGAGKSTILEAIAWAVYGAAAARGTNDTIRFTRAAPRARVVVELTFELDNHEFRVVRALNTAEVYLDNSVNPVAVGVGGATAFLQTKLGMTRQEFFNTYFTGQKELQFLAQMGPTDRGRFLAQVLGYERLRKAQDIARNKRNQIASEMIGLKTGLPDPVALNETKIATEQRVKLAKKALAQAEKAQARLDKQFAVAKPAWDAMQETREKAQRLAFEIESGMRELDAARREVERTTAELKKVAAAEASLAAVRPQLEELMVVTAAADKLDELSRAHARRTVLKENENRLLDELKKLGATLDGLKQAPMLLKRAQEELAELKQALPETVKLRETLLADYQKDAQDNRTELRILESQLQELEQQIAKLQDAGEAGSCPICAKPLGEEYGGVLEHLQLEVEDRRNIIKWRKSREKQLAKRPGALVEAERILAQLQTSIEKKTEREAKCEQGAKELWERTEEKQLKEKQLAELQAELAGIPAGYDREQHTRIRNRMIELQELARQATVYEHEVAARGTREAEVAAAGERVAVLDAQLKDRKSALADLKFEEQRYAAERASFEKLNAETQASKFAAVEAVQVLRGADEALQSVQRAESEYAEKRAKLEVLESELKHHHEMDNAVAQLRTELNRRVRPELAELASLHLTEITDGRYNALEIDEGYNVLVLEDGEEKPVISGGEEDVANLVLRIAISQMIAERAGQQLSSLFLDEVFGSLDLERRENVIQLLQKLRDRFEQVVLITHVETVREGLDHVIRLEYDERSGASVIKEDVLAPDLALLV